MLDSQAQGLKGDSAGDPPAIGAYAIKVAVDILEGTKPAERFVAVPVPTTTTDTLVVGVNVFPDLSPTLDADTDIPGANLGLTIEDAVAK